MHQIFAMGKELARAREEQHESRLRRASLIPIAGPVSSYQQTQAELGYRFYARHQRWHTPGAGGPGVEFTAYNTTPNNASASEQLRSWYRCTLVYPNAMSLDRPTIAMSTPPAHDTTIRASGRAIREPNQLMTSGFYNHHPRRTSLPGDFRQPSTSSSNTKVHQLTSPLTIRITQPSRAANPLSGIGPATIPTPIKPCRLHITDMYYKYIDSLCLDSITGVRVR